MFSRSLLEAIKTPQYFQIVPVLVEIEESIPLDPITSKVLMKLEIPAERKIRSMNMFSLTIPTELLFDVASIDYVKKIHLNRMHYAFPKFKPLDPFNLLGEAPTPEEQLEQMHDKIFGTQEGWIPTSQAIKATNVDLLHDKGHTGFGVDLWVLDTGTDVAHPQLDDRMNGAFTQTLGSPHDGNGHGSHCCTVAGGGYWKHPVNKLEMIGVAPNCYLTSVKVLTDIGSGATDSILAAGEMALRNGAEVISMSLGSGGAADEEQDPLVMQINEAAETHPETTFVIANGNSGPEMKSAGIPAVADNCISVGAWDIVKHQVANFSSRGPSIELGKTLPDIVAPGVDIYSGLSLSSILDTVDRQINRASPLSGTSMATPHVAGIMALWKEITNHEITTADIKRMFREFGKPADNISGHGLIDASWIFNIV